MTIDSQTIPCLCNELEYRKARSKFLQKQMELNTQKNKLADNEQIQNQLEYENTKYLKEVQDLERETQILKKCLDILA